MESSREKGEIIGVISILYRSNSASSKHALNWFERYGINYKKKPISEVSKKELIHILTLSDTGFEGIVKCTNKCDLSTYEKIKHMEKLTFNRAVDFLLSHVELLRNPIIFEERNYMVGYNDVEIRRFFPKEYRHLHF